MTKVAFAIKAKVQMKLHWLMPLQGQGFNIQAAQTQARN
jgi:hypothetical protein